MNDALTTTEKPRVAVFNRSSQLYGFSLPDGSYTQIKSGRWVHVPSILANTYLLSDPNFNIRAPWLRALVWGNPRQLAVAGPIDTVTGWGRMNVNLIKILAERLGERVSLYPVSYWNYDDVPDAVADKMRAPFIPAARTLALTLPTELPYIPSRKITLFSMWETGQLPQEWGELVNRYCDSLIVPSEEQVKVWRAGGVTKNISVVPLGVDTQLWQYQERPARSDQDPFTILCEGSPLTSRKSPIETLRVCYQAFESGEYGSPVDNWKLILKTTNNVLGAGTFTLPLDSQNVQIIAYALHEKELIDLHYQCDCAIMLSRYEGYGLIAREQMATGLPVILSANTGHLDDCNPSLNFPIPSVGLVPASQAYSGEEEWSWHEPDYEQAARVLRAEYEDWVRRGRTQSNLGRDAAAFVHAQRTWDRTVDGVLEVMNHADGTRSGQPTAARPDHAVESA